MEPATVQVVLQAVASGAIARLLKTYFGSTTGSQHLLSSEVKGEFQRCLRLATITFLESIGKEVRENENVCNFEERALIQYLESPEVTEEISHLLDPGVEVFDRGRVTQAAREFLPKDVNEEVLQVIFDAWDNFLKAFSFASRSAHQLREFLRASYEAGSFRALANIEDVLDKMSNAVSEIDREELAMRKAVKTYFDELQVYKDWAMGYQLGGGV